MSSLALDLAHIGAVVIGRNEGDRLMACLDSVQSRVGTTVFVDSGSTDGSPERARARGARVLTLTSGPFTAARGRQTGVEELVRAAPGVEFVLFIDGDCILDPAFIERAYQHLAANPRTAAVAGRRREQHKTFYSRLVDIDWDIPAGRVGYVGGDGLWRIAALNDAGGWAIDLIAGEEPDLCFRLSDAGWNFERIGVEMTLHDIRMTTFGQYWRRASRTGHAYIEVGWRRRHGAGRAWVRKAASIVLYALVLPIAAIALGVWFWPGAVVVGLLYVRVLVSIVLHCRAKGCTMGLALAYAILTMVCKFAGLVGMARYLVGRLTGARTRLIEYQPASAPKKDAYTPAAETLPEPDARP